MVSAVLLHSLWATAHACACCMGVHIYGVTHLHPSNHKSLESSPWDRIEYVPEWQLRMYSGLPRTFTSFTKFQPRHASARQQMMDRHKPPKRPQGTPSWLDRGRSVIKHS